MLCLQCGTTVEDAAAWCTSCGAPIQKPAADAESTAPGEPLAEALERQATGAHGAPKENPAKPTQLEKGRVIDGKYSVTRVLGEGGMGVVYLARDVNTGSDVVLKSVRPDLAHRKDIRERTLAEGRALARIDHPNVVHLNAVVSEGQHLWLVMQYIDGESLDKTIARAEKDGAHLPFPKALALFKQILRGVGAAHDEGVIHRDLKPANILVRAKDGIAKVTDFGIAKPLDKETGAAEKAGNTKGVIGSLWYMSPEQVQGKKDLDKRVDIYGLGILFFELLTGHVPFDAQSSYELMRKHVEDPLPKVRGVRTDVPAWVDDVLAVACAKKREERFSSCEDMLGAIEAHAAPGASAPGATREVAARTQSDLQPIDQRRSITGLIVALVVVALAATGVALYFAVFDQPAPAPRKKKPSATATVTTDPPPGESSSVPDAPPPSATVEPPPKPDPAEILVGAWKSESGRLFDAVRVGKSVELRVHDAKQFKPADYRDGETRFTLTPIDGEDGAYAVEDKIRPDPPQGSTYDEKSRSTCQQLWTEVGKKPLRATFDGARIALDFALIEPTIANFVQDGKKVVSCSNLKSVKASLGRVSFERVN